MDVDDGLRADNQPVYAKNDAGTEQGGKIYRVA